MKKTRPWITLQGLIAVSIVVCLLAMLVVTAFQGYRGARAVLVAAARQDPRNAALSRQALAAEKMCDAVTRACATATNEMWLLMTGNFFVGGHELKAKMARLVKEMGL